MSRSAAPAGPLVEELCSAARSRAKALGHRLGDWEDATEGRAVARRARCRRCDRVAYIRLEDDLLGMAGEAFAGSCPGRPEGSAAGPEQPVQA